MSGATNVATPSYAGVVRPLGAVAAARARIAAIDVMRGLVIVLMLLVHVREAIYLHKQIGDPMDVDATEPALFFTRLTAHLCAPTFVFLTGLGAWLYANPPGVPARSPREFLLKRGLMLILLEVTLVNFSWAGDMPPQTLWLQVIWAIGISMVALALLSGLPRWVIATIGFAIVFGHNLLTPITFPPGHPLYAIWTILHERAFLVADGALKIKVTYPVLPWIGVILLGYATGPLYSQAVDAARRAKLLVLLGIGCFALLLVLRGFNIYGETLPWVPGADFTHTLMSFLNFTKYPPSLDFLLATLGTAFLLMAWFERVDNRLTHALAVFGSAPLFFYLLHLYVLLILQKVAVATVGPTHGTRFGVDDFYWVWIGAVLLAVVLYLPTRAFARYKRASKQAWVRYF
ncbi:MAG TPA: heparan-alpha-glucosaminide N-acetyltransferase domain-containing protein [Steroidobacteraceae bacterium]|nr:heparan-alpha-glucosaminide N-acetyltransferase domain-containing protein [Steroidobacteraceae bacterium]